MAFPFVYLSVCVPWVGRHRGGLDTNLAGVKEYDDTESCEWVRRGRHNLWSVYRTDR